MNNQMHDRRRFLQKSALATLTALVGTDVIFAHNIPRHYVPLGLDADYDPLKGKKPRYESAGRQTLECRIRRFTC